ncbi:hypothetical protein K4A83_00395 [Spirulina subsalsa FACHB-351]|uniref:Uncharacterized protein n=1 Tax=Spirulina subsalsa FACHB-351 TaxID=234711 RepID=A0ABT3KZR3_9CYAN|nr:hypothetical protein [Spirulina subsalsa]MCW6034738.1 hypothetical protein [Spirulina subsalsa FACHB-351]
MLMSSSAKVPQYFQDLIEFYPQSEGAGVAIFYQVTPPGVDLEQVALHQYQTFLGQKWEQRSESWMRPWKRVYQRTRDVKANFVGEMTAATVLVGRHDQKWVLKLLRINSDDYVQAYTVLNAGFNCPEAEEFRVYSIGEDEEIQGLLGISRRRNGEILTLALWDD